MTPQGLLSLCNVTTGKLDSNAAVEGGAYPFFTCAPQTLAINTYAFDTEAVLLAGNNASGVFPVNYFNGKFNAYQRTYVLESKDTDVLDNRFLFFALQLQLKLLQNLSTGAATKFLTLGIMKEIQVPAVSIVDQRKIVGILSAYDNLITANQRRIQLLEESARLLYREWFVKLRFPGHETVPVVDGVPEGWDIPKLAEIVDVNTSAISAKNHPELIRYIDISSVETGEIGDVDEVSFDEAPGRARRRVQHGDVIWSCVRPNRRSYALIWEPEDNLIVSTGFAVLTARAVTFSYLYFTSTTDDFVSYLTSVATGAAYPAVTAKDFEKAPILLPDKETLEAFDRIVLPMLEQIETIKRHTKQLRQARYLLLPRLMSGALDVSRFTLPKEVVP